MITTLDVLSVGSLNPNNFVRDVLLSRRTCRLVAAMCVWNLSAILASGKIDVAICHDTLSPGELQNCAVYIRHHWPAARILLISAHSEAVDDPLYDEWTRPEISQDAFLSIIERLAIDAKRNKHQPFERQTCSGERRK
jgi:hypothetical protein